MGFALIKWLAIAVLVAGTFGIFWTAPWKDDVERVTDSVQSTITKAKDTLGVLDSATGGNCKKVGQAAPANVTTAVETLAAEAEKSPDARLRGVIDGVENPTLREVAEAQAKLIGDCLKSAPNTGAGWKDLQQKLQVAAQGR